MLQTGFYGFDPNENDGTFTIDKDHWFDMSIREFRRLSSLYQCLKNHVKEHTKYYLAIVNFSRKFKACPSTKSLVFEKKPVILRNKQCC